MDALIRAIAGPLRGALFRLVEQEVKIGRQPSNHLCIGDVSVSRFHCVIQIKEGRYKVKDLYSHNGTLVNGKAISESFLKTGDQLAIGDTTFEFSEGVANLPDLLVPVSDRETVESLRIERVQPQLKTQFIDEFRLDTDFNRLSALGAMGRLLNSAEKMDCLEVEVLAAICNFARAEKAAVFLTRRGEWIAFAWDKQEGPCQPAFAVREIVDQVFKQQISMIATVQEKAKSVIAVPLIIRDILSGALYLERGLQSQPFTGSDLEFVVGLSNYEAVALDHSQRLAQLETENRRMRNEVQLRHKMIGQSPPMQEVYARIARIAPTDATVLIRGETGTGKELAARAIHENSPRAGQLFAPINCALLSGALLGSELFGHEKGAFTGAVAQKKGKLEIANGGSVFLDEVTELPEVTQSMLLRVLQEHTFERLGGTNAIQADIRIIAATNKNLEATVRARRFRQDLYYRLNVVSVSLPPLRERREDISLLTDYFVRRTSEKKSRVVTGISAEAMAYLQAYHWPGNIRELENAIEHAIVFGGTDHIMPEDLPEPLLARTPQAAVPAIDYQNAVRKAKQQIVRNALEQARGDHAKAAELLHIHPNNLYRLMRDLDVKPRVHMSKSG